MAVYAFVNGKGGVGKTVTTLGVADALSMAGRDVVVVDADLNMNNVDREADVELDAALTGECTVAEELDPDPERPSVLSGQRRIGEAEDVAAENLPRVLDRLDERSEFVLVDAPPGLRDELVYTLQHADGSFVVTTPRRPSLENGRKTVQLADRAGGTVLGTVVVRARPDTDLAAIESELDLPAVGVVPDDPRVEEATGLPTEEPAPGSATEGYGHLARLLEACRTASDPAVAAREFEPPSLPNRLPGREATAGAAADETGRAEPDSAAADELLGDDGPRMGTARSAQDHLDRLQDAMDRASGNGNDT